MVWREPYARLYAAELRSIDQEHSQEPDLDGPHTCSAKLEEIMALADKVDGPLPQEGERTILEMTRRERNLIADALTAL